MEDTLFFKDPSGHRIAAVLAKPDHPTDHIAVLCHGFLSHKNSSSNKALTTLLVERGIAAFRFDCFGHGESDGPCAKLTTTLASRQVLAALRHVYELGYRRLSLVGSSFGGLISLFAAADWTTTHMSNPSSIPPLACLALKCPVVDFAEELRSHLDIEIERLRAQGMSPADAERAARRSFGNVGIVQDRLYQGQRLASIAVLNLGR